MHSTVTESGYFKKLNGDGAMHLGKIRIVLSYKRYQSYGLLQYQQLSYSKFFFNFLLFDYGTGLIFISQDAVCETTQIAFFKTEQYYEWLLKGQIN